MSYNCYFCATKLIRLRSGARHYVCKKCPIVNDKYYDVWKHPYFVFTDDYGILLFFLYFRQVNVWLRQDISISEKPCITIFDQNLIEILQMDINIDIMNIAPNVLENKIKTWILFS